MLQVPGIGEHAWARQEAVRRAPLDGAAVVEHQHFVDAGERYDSMCDDDDRAVSRGIKYCA